MLFPLGNSLLSRIVKYITFLISLTSIITILLILSIENLTIKRNIATIDIDISNKLNICVEDE